VSEHRPEEPAEDEGERDQALEDAPPIDE